MIEQLLKCKKYFEQVYLQKNLSAIEDFYTPKASVISPYGISRGHLQIRESIILLNQTLDIHEFTIHNSIFKDDSLIIIVGMKATFLKNWMTIPCKGKATEINSNIIYRFDGDKVCEGVYVFDFDHMIKKVTRSKQHFKENFFEYQEESLICHIQQEVENLGLKIALQPLRCSVLKHYGLKSKNIAHLLNCGVDTVSSHLKLARQIFYDEFQYGSIEKLLDSPGVKQVVQRYCRLMLSLHL